MIRIAKDLLDEVGPWVTAEEVRKGGIAFEKQWDDSPLVFLEELETLDDSPLPL